LDRVIVDTSSILLGFENGKSVFEAIIGQLGARSVLVSKGIINELDTISKSKGTRGADARAALRELSLKKIRIEADSKYPDSWIMERAAESGVSAVVTNDTKLALEIRKREEVDVFKFSREGKLKRLR